MRLRKKYLNIQVAGILCINPFKTCTNSPNLCAFEFQIQIDDKLFTNDIEEALTNHQVEVEISL